MDGEPSIPALCAHLMAKMDYVESAIMKSSMDPDVGLFLQTMQNVSERCEGALRYLAAENERMRAENARMRRMIERLTPPVAQNQ